MIKLCAHMIGAVGVSAALSGCMIQPKTIGQTPQLSPMSVDAQYQTHTKEELGSMYPDTPRKYSTWNNSAASLFTGRQAMNRGDILTVNIVLNDRAQFDNRSDRQRTSSKSIGLGANTSGGFAGSIDGSLNSGTTFDGSGGTTRQEKLDVSIAAVVMEVLQNGNLVIRGTQEIVVNAEKRVMTVEGIVRPSDILPDSSVPYEKIAEARISYGGQGRITEVQQPPYGQQALDMLLPL
ncbi:flagellar basal body L-ring protein FlgH [Ahrensia kielensis]|uniref:Flagellar L-ring protein n=1 Tax=Ahrensia kielensis TaxID=76980 RepID=A0ABU9T8N4_9HYPH